MSDPPGTVRAVGKRDIASNLLVMAVDGWPGNGRSAEQVVTAMRATGADPRLLSQHAARHLDRPAVVGLFVAAGATQELIEEYTPKRPAGSGFRLADLADGIQHQN